MPDPNSPLASAPRKVANRPWRLMALGLILALHGTLTWMAREPGMLTGQDDAEYVTLAKSLRQGGYHELHRVDNPLHAQYPLGYPAMLAVWGGVFGDGFDALTALTVLLSMLSLALVFAVLRRVLGEDIALLTALVLAFNPQVVHFAGAIMSEIPYLALTLVALALLARKGAGKGVEVAVIALVIAAALTRTAGVTIVAAAGLYFVLSSKWRSVTALGLAASVLLGGWLLWTIMAPDQYIGTSYVADFAAADRLSYVPPLPRRTIRNVLWYGGTAIPWALGVPTIAGTPLDNALVVLLIGITTAAGLVVFARRWRVGLLYTLMYGGLLTVWVWRVERFLVPVLFLVVSAMLAGARALGGRRGPMLAGGLALALAVSGGARSVARAVERRGCAPTDSLPAANCIAPDQASWFDAIRWIRTNTDPNAVMVTAKNAPLWLYTGRRSVSYEAALAQSDSSFIPFLRSEGADYILIGSLHFDEPRGLIGLIEPNCSQLTVAAFFPLRTWLFSLGPPDSVEEAGRACRAVAEYREANR